MANSQVTTIVLLITIGAVLYYINKNDTENLENTDMINDIIDNADEENIEDETIENDIQNTEDNTTDNQITTQTTKLEGDVITSSGVSGMESTNMGGGSGASLDTAFMGAVPPSTAVDQVDFNRNNVTEYDSTNFLPKEVNDEWFDTDFTQAKYNLNDDKMINTDRYMIGVNTVGQTLKNPSYDIRGTIPNPKYTVSPWNNSTYEPDNNLKSLC